MKANRQTVERTLTRRHGVMLPVALRAQMFHTGLHNREMPSSASLWPLSTFACLDIALQHVLTPDAFLLL